jgi:cytochrome c biogenesis protein CcdA
MNIVALTLSLSLFDSLSTTQQIIIFALLLTTDKPIRNSLSFLLGLSGMYFLCGVGGFMALEQLTIFLSKYFPSTGSMSDPNYYLMEFASGTLMMVIGLWYYRKKRYAPANRSQNLFISKLRSMNSLPALGIGALISLTSFPVSIPYLFALGKYSSLHMSLAVASGNILLYNIGYALPMLVILPVYLYARGKTEDITDTLHEKTRMLNVQLTTWTLVAVGLFSMIDSGCYYIIGHALIKGRFF